MTGGANHAIASFWGDAQHRTRNLEIPASRHCEERSDRSNPFFVSAASWIASRSPSSGAHPRDPLARNDGLAKLPDGQISSCFARLPVQPHLQKYFGLRLTQISSLIRPVPSHRGAARDRHERGAGCDGRGSARDERGLLAYGEVVSFWRPDAGVKSCGIFCGTTVSNKPGHRGEREGNRKTIARGMPVDPSEPVVTTLVCFT
jgi:hypothetical protein